MEKTMPRKMTGEQLAKMIRTNEKKFRPWRRLLHWLFVKRMKDW